MFRRALLVLALAPLPLAALPVAAQAATPSPPAGGVATARQDLFAHQVTVTGWAYDPARSAASIDVQVYVDGTYAGHVRADRPSPRLDASRHISGRHVFRFARSWTRTARSVTVRSAGVGRAASRTALDSSSVTRFMPSPGARIVAVAKRYVGRARYVEGGATPRGFDCSGYTKYVFAKARVRTLPHNAEGQRRMKGMRHITRSVARAGDLVFYLSGGRAYHVAVYAGRGMQYAAATPRDGVRYQKVWSSAVEYRTNWH